MPSDELQVINLVYEGLLRELSRQPIMEELDQLMTRRS